MCTKHNVEVVTRGFLKGKLWEKRKLNIRIYLLVNVWCYHHVNGNVWCTSKMEFQYTMQWCGEDVSPELRSLEWTVRAFTLLLHIEIVERVLKRY